MISPQAQLDYDLQLPLFGDLPLRKKLAEDGIDFIAHYISQTASNTSGVHGTGTAYAQQVDFGVSFDLDKLGVWPDAIARYAMTDRAGRNLTDRTGGYFPYQSIFGPANPDLSAVQAGLPTTLDAETRLRRALDRDCRDYDFILFDTPPSFAFHTISVLAATDFIVIPMQMSGYAVKGLKETLRSVHHVRQELNPDLRVLGLLPTFVVMRTRFSRDLLDGLRAIPNLRVFNTVIKVTVRLQESALAGEPVTVMAPSPEAAAAYRSFAAEVLAALIAEGEHGVELAHRVAGGASGSPRAFSTRPTSGGCWPGRVKLITVEAPAGIGSTHPAPVPPTIARSPSLLSAGGGWIPVAVAGVVIVVIFVVGIFSLCATIFLYS